MSQTELQLLVLFRSPVVKLDDICQEYLGMHRLTANSKASLNLLPIPTMRLSDSRKAPRMVKVADLAAYLDAKASQAKESWEASQV